MATRRSPLGGEGAGAEGPMDPSSLVQCPYDKSHQVRVSRLPYHLVKCQRNNPRAARALASCPFNARHKLPKSKLRSHVASCPDRRPLDPPRELPPGLGEGVKKPPVAVDPQEDWEAELENLEDPTPFVLNARAGDLLPWDSSTPAAPPGRSRGGRGAQQSPPRPEEPGGAPGGGTGTRRVPAPPPPVRGHRGHRGHGGGGDIGEGAGEGGGLSPAGPKALKWI